LRTISRHIKELYRVIDSVHRSGPGRTLLVGHTLSFATRIYEEASGLPAVTVQLSPSVFRSDFEQPTLAAGLNFSRFPRWFKRSMMWLIDRHYVDPYILPALNECRAAHGLAAISRPFGEWMHSPQGVIGLFPPWFAEAQPDWPRPLHLTGFPLFDEGQLDGPEPALEEFLRGGDPPIVYTPGSANAQAPSFFRSAIEATVLLRKRALLLTKFPEQVPASLPAGIMHVRYAPFSQVLPRCAALVHHGGIGSCAQGLAAGVPQLVMPMGFDQPDNAARLKFLGVGQWVTPRRFTGKRVARVLSRLLDSPTTAAATYKYAQRLKENGALPQACDVIEAVASVNTADPQERARHVPASAA
jgi:UDP:flavonoid glycosyltransferase YjiC (YdhE family)